MPTIFETQYPSGIVERSLTLNNNNRTTMQYVAPLNQDAIAIPEPNPYVAWQLGDKTTIIDPTTILPIQVVGIDISDYSSEFEEEFHIFVGAAGFEQFLAAVPINRYRRGFIPVNCPVIPPLSRLSVARATSQESAITVPVKLVYRILQTTPS